MKKPRAVILAVGLALLVLLVWPALAQADTTELVSVSGDEIQGDGDCYEPSISADGNFVAFESDSDSLVAEVTNPSCDIFVRNLVAGTTELVSVSSDEVPGNDHSGGPSINADGTIVAFESDSTNLVVALGDDDLQQIYVRYLLTGATELVSVAADGESYADGECYEPSISADGSAVAFMSGATNLVTGVGDGWDPQIYVRYLSGLLAGTTVVASVSDDEVPVLANSASLDPSINANGTVVAFISYADNLVEDGPSEGEGVYVRDLAAGTTVLASVSSGGVLGDGEYNHPSINANGTVVAFESDASNLVAEATNSSCDIFVRNRVAGTTTLVSVSSEEVPGNDHSGPPSINADGTVVAFESRADNLVAGDTNDCEDIFVRNLVTGTTKLVSWGWDGSPADDDSEDPSISADGSRVAFESDATNLVLGDINDEDDIFVVYIAKKQAGGYPNRYEQTDPRILYSGQWETQENKAHSGGSIYFTNDKTATITITFKGTRLDWIAALGPLMGKVLVTIDGGEPVLVDLFSDSELFQQLVWSTGELEYGVHTITITFPEGSDYQEGKGINIDALDIWGVLLASTGA
jgi:Tol biopolymer transport system component